MDWILPIAVVLAACGTIFIALGFRGRRIDDRPRCAKCRFDLVGLVGPDVPAGVAHETVCPECGAYLAIGGAVRMGLRQRRPRLILIGAAILLPASAPTLALFYSVLLGTSINQHEPFEMLLWEASRAQPGRSSSVFRELQRRMYAGKLNAGKTLRACNAALAAQADLARPWNEDWYLVLDGAQNSGMLPFQLQRQFELSAAVLEVQTRPSVVAGSTVPFGLELKEARVGSVMAVLVSATPRGVRIGSQPCEVRTDCALTRRGTSALRQSLGEATIFRARGSRAAATSPQWVQFMQPLQRPDPWELDVPSGLRPGTYDMEVDVGIDAVPEAPGQLPRGTITSGFGEIIVTLRTTIEVHAAGTPLAERIPRTDELDQKLREWLDQATVERWWWYHRGLLVRTMFPASEPPIPIAYAIEARAGSQIWDLGYFVSGHGLHTVGEQDHPQSRFAFWHADLPDIDSVTVVLTPASLAAANTLDMDRFYDGQITLQQVPVKTLYGNPGVRLGQGP